MPKIQMTDWPPYAKRDEARREGTMMAARLMANAAQTAPKAGGVDQVECELVYGFDEQEEIARKNRRAFEEKPQEQDVVQDLSY